MKQLFGTGVALVTPFTKNFSVDVNALEKIVEYAIQGGIDYLVVLGTTGESVTLSKDEKKLVINTVIKTNAGRLPLVIGIGGNNTYAVEKELKSTNLDNFDAVLSVSPYYNKPTQEGIYQHFKVLAEASPKPLILYNVPGRTGSNMTADTVLRLANDFDTIVAVKEASGDMLQIMQIIQNKPTDFHVLSGDDITALPTVLSGGSGVISVIGQGVPVEFSNMIRLALQGQPDAAYEIHYSLQKGMELIFKEGNPAGIKAIFETLGLSTPTVRLPLIEATENLKSEIANFVDSFTGINA